MNVIKRAPRLGLYRESNSPSLATRAYQTRAAISSTKLASALCGPSMILMEVSSGS